jgi:hypothetical protein
LRESVSHYTVKAIKVGLFKKFWIDNDLLSNW